MDKSKGVKIGANSSDVTFFYFWLNSINFCLSEVDVTTDPEKTDNPNTGAADTDEPDIGTADPKIVDGAETNGTDVEGAEKPGIGTTNPAEIDGAEVDGAKVDKADESDIGPADLANLMELDGADKKGTDTID